MLIDRLLFELSCKNRETQKRRNMETHTDFDEYSTVAFCKNTTIREILRLTTMLLIFLLPFTGLDTNQGTKSCVYLDTRFPKLRETECKEKLLFICSINTIASNTSMCYYIIIIC